MSRGADSVTVTRSQDGPGDFCGAAEAAKILGVERTRVSRYDKQGKMPMKLAKLASGPVYLRSEVEAMKRRMDSRKAASSDIR